MYVSELLDFMLIQESDCKIWSNEDETFIFEGMICEAKVKYGRFEIISFEVSDNTLIVNI